MRRPELLARREWLGRSKKMLVSRWGPRWCAWRRRRVFRTAAWLGSWSLISISRGMVDPFLPRRHDDTMECNHGEHGGHGDILEYSYAISSVGTRHRTLGRHHFHGI